jgi:hypothetical protein
MSSSRVACPFAVWVCVPPQSPRLASNACHYRFFTILLRASNDFNRIAHQKTNRLRLEVHVIIVSDSQLPSIIQSPTPARNRWKFIVWLQITWRKKGQKKYLRSLLHLKALLPHRIFVALRPCDIRSVRRRFIG